jgi:hypothetical protein
MAFQRPSSTSLAAGGLVILGFGLSNVGGAWWWGILLTGIGTFGPGLLRELGWLKDKDEFQIQANRRAGYHAFLIAGLAAFLWIGFMRSADRQLLKPELLADFFLALLWFTWMFSALVSYWGARKTATRVLLIYGGVWLLFNILGNLAHPLALLMQSLIAVPFFAGAAVARRWPRVAGLFLLGASAFFFRMFVFSPWHREHLGLVDNLTTAVLLDGPLFASGLALLFREAEGPEPDLPQVADATS